MLRVAPWVVSTVVSSGSANHYRSDLATLFRIYSAQLRLPPRSMRGKDSTPPRHRWSIHDHVLHSGRRYVQVALGLTLPGQFSKAFFAIPR